MADKARFQQLQLPERIDIETLARLLGVGERYVRRMVAERRLPTVKVGHYFRFDLADVLQWIEAQRRPGRALRSSAAMVLPDKTL